MLIKTTDASHCKIKDVKVSGKEAHITLIIYSSKPQSMNETTGTIHHAFRLFLRDKSSELTSLNNNNYWIDRCDNYNNDSNNIDINLYKEIIVKVDISNSNKSPMKNSRWVRECSIVLLDSDNEVCWESETLPLISQDIVVPTISNIKVNINADSQLHISFKETFESQEDFNYINNNLHTTVEIRSAVSNKPIETLEVTEVDSNGLVELETFEHEFDSPITVIIQVLNNQDQVLVQAKKFYNPNTRYKVFTKQGNEVKQIIACSVDNKRVSGVHTR